MENTRRYLLALATFFASIYCSSGTISLRELLEQRKLPNSLTELIQQRKLRAPVIHELTESGNSGTVRITCIATSKPAPTIAWTFNDRPVNKTSYTSIQNGSVLVLKDATEANTGKYQCLASNEFGRMFQELTLRIKSVGKFEEGFQKYDECQFRNVTVGRSFELECPPHTSAYGQEIKWVQDPFRIWKPGQPIDRIFQTSNGNLTFSYLERSDIGRINRRGGISCLLAIDVIAIPSVKIKLFEIGKEYTGTTKPSIIVFMEKTTEVVAGTSIKLLCGAKGKPNPKLVWHKDGKRIYYPLDDMLKQDGLTVEGKGMVINFRSVKPEHEGTYKCIATNTAGEDSREATLIVNLPVRWKKPLSLHINARFRDAVRLECIAEGKPNAKYTWMHNDTVIKATPTRKITGGLLEIPVANFFDAGLYLCIAENVVNKKVTATYVNVEAFPPTFTTPLKEVDYFITGTTNTLHCNVDGGPPPNIQWFHNGVTSVGRQAKLVFKKITKTSNGVYKCVATNVKGKVEDSTEVKVYDRTVITKGPAHFTFQTGSVANLFCEADYDDTLKVTIEWLKDGKVLTYDSRVKLMKGIKWSTTGLQINNLEINDAGIYTCRVFTVEDTAFRSQDEKTGSITVIGDPAKPEDLKLVGDCGEKEVNLTWKAPSNFIGPVTSYVIEYSDVKDSPTWYPYETPTEITATSFKVKTTDLPPSSNIKFRVKSVAWNMGKKILSEAAYEDTKASACIVGPGAPFAAPMGLNVAMDGNDSITVSWDEFDPIFQTGDDFKIVGTYKKIVNGTVVDTKTVKLGGNDTSFKIPIDAISENDDGKYEITVWAENSQGAGPKATITVEHPSNIALPTKLDNVRVHSVTDTSVTMMWDELDSASGYTIYYYDSTSSRRRRNAVVKTNSRKLLGSKTTTVRNNGTIDGLAASKKYEVEVAAQNVKGEGPKSDAIEVKTAPDIPKGVVLKTFGDAIALKWEPPEKDDDVTGYDVTWYPSGEDDPAKKKSKQLGPDSQSAFITSDLDPFKYYTVELTPRSKDGKGKPWKMVGVVVGKPDQPGKPAPPTLEALNISTIQVTFNLPTQTTNSGGLPSKFHVYYVKKGDTDKKKKTVQFPEQGTLLLLNLELEEYSVWTVGENSEGQGDPSEKVKGMPLPPTTTTPPTTTPIPTTIANITGNITAGRTYFKDAGKEFYSELWFIILIALILLILLLALIVCAVMNNGNAGRYPVGRKEKKYGGWDNNQQLQDYSDNPTDKQNGVPFKDNKNPVRSASDNSLAKVPILDDNDDDADSLDDYQEDNTFAEDGSFIGEYGDEKQSYTNNALQ